MAENLPNIEYKRTKQNPTIDSETTMYELSFYKDADYLANIDNFVAFVKSVERMIRNSKYYKRYIKYIKEDVGLNFCQVLSNIRVEDEKAKTKIEMHHGPILTLFDYVSIVVDWMLIKGKKITTFDVADIVIEEHFNNNIQVVMLSETVHQAVHDDGIFLNINHAFGDLNAFIKKYRDGISDEMISRINKYLSVCEQYDSFDKHILDLKDTVRSWSVYEEDED